MPIGPEPTPVPDLTSAQINQAANVIVNAYRNNLDTIANIIGATNINRSDAMKILQLALFKVGQNVQGAAF